MVTLVLVVLVVLGLAIPVWLAIMVERRKMRDQLELAELVTTQDLLTAVTPEPRILKPWDGKPLTPAPPPGPAGMSPLERALRDPYSYLAPSPNRYHDPRLLEGVESLLKKGSVVAPFVAVQGVQHAAPKKRPARKAKRKAGRKAKLRKSR